MKNKALSPKTTAIIGLLAVLFLLPWACSQQPTAPAPFIRIELQVVGTPDSTSYTGVPVEIAAELDSAVPFGEIQWHTGKGIPKRRDLLDSDTTSVDTIWVTWAELPALDTAGRGRTLDSAARSQPVTPTDTVWAEFRGSISNKLKVAVWNRAPSIDSVIVNGRKVTVRNDSISIAGNHGTIAYITVYASDADSAPRLSTEIIHHDNKGKVVSVTDVTPTPLASRTYWKWDVQWQAYPVDSLGDSTAVTTATIRVSDQKGGSASLPARIVIYRESGSIWLASTQENTSTLIKYSDSGKELFRIPGFQEINCLAVSPSREVVWLTDRKAGMIHCVDDDGNTKFSTSGFVEPRAIDVHDERGYCVVLDRDTIGGITSRMRIVNRNGQGRIDSSITTTVNGDGVFVKLDQLKLNDTWVLWLGKSTTDTLDYIEHFRGWWASVSLPLGHLRNPSHLDINSGMGHMWVADKGANRVVKMGTPGDTIIAAIVGFRNPHMMAVNTTDTSCWVADTDNNRIIKLVDGVQDGYDIEQGSSPPNGYHVEVDGAFGIDFKQPIALAVNPHENGGVVWVVDTQNNRIVKLDADGVPLLSITEYGMESSSYIAVNTGTK